METQAHVWSIEGVVESGRRVAKAIDRLVTVIDQYFPRWLRIICRIDDLFYAVKGPHVIDIAVGIILFSIVWYFMKK